MPEVKPVSSGEWGQLSCLGPCIVLINAAAVSYQERAPGVGVQPALIERSMLMCKSKGEADGGSLELEGIWTCRTKSSLFYATHGKSLTSRSPAPHLQGAREKWFVCVCFPLLFCSYVCKGARLSKTVCALIMWNCTIINKIVKLA